MRKISAEPDNHARQTSPHTEKEMPESASDEKLPEHSDHTGIENIAIISEQSPDDSHALDREVSEDQGSTTVIAMPEGGMVVPENTVSDGDNETIGTQARTSSGKPQGLIRRWTSRWLSRLVSWVKRLVGFR